MIPLGESLIVCITQVGSHRKQLDRVERGGRGLIIQNMLNRGFTVFYVNQCCADTRASSEDVLFRDRFVCMLMPLINHLLCVVFYLESIPPPHSSGRLYYYIISDLSNWRATEMLLRRKCACTWRCHLTCHLTSPSRWPKNATFHAGVKCEYFCLLFNTLSLF